MSDTAPAEFARGDLWRGALYAWIAFMVLMELALVIAAYVGDSLAPGASGSNVAYLPVFVIYSLMIGGVVSCVVALLCIPLAALLGLAMRSVRSRPLHYLAFAGLGAAVGYLVVLIVAASAGGDHLLGVTAVVTTLICALATAYGRWCAERCRQRRTEMLSAPAA